MSGQQIKNDTYYLRKKAWREMVNNTNRALSQMSIANITDSLKTTRCNLERYFCYSFYIAHQMGLLSMDLLNQTEQMISDMFSQDPFPNLSQQRLT
jgi:hypothetical protein